MECRYSNSNVSTTCTMAHIHRHGILDTQCPLPSVVPDVNMAFDIVNYKITKGLFVISWVREHKLTFDLCFNLEHLGNNGNGLGVGILSNAEGNR